MSPTGQVVAAAPPEGVEVFSPANPHELSGYLKEATSSGTRVAIWGGGTHRDIGYDGAFDVVVSTSRITGIEEWVPDDLTVVVRSGTPVAELEAELNSGGQTAILPEQPGQATVGGVVATGVSGYARLRYGPTRDRILEVQAVTGDGRQIKGGGRVVKNVTGYDLPRLYAGSFGALGIITSVCLKLWPLTEVSATVFLDEVPSQEAIYRPRAVLQTPEGVRVLLSGTEREVADIAGRLGGEQRPGLHLPDPVTGPTVWSARVTPSLLSQTVGRFPPGTPYVAQHGVGEVTFVAEDELFVAALRSWVEETGGAVVRMRGQSDLDPWGTPPSTLELQRRIVAAFDPARIIERGRLPGGL